MTTKLRQQGVFGFGTIRPDRFPSSSYQNWRDWRKHFAWIADANRLDNEQARMVLPTCLQAGHWMRSRVCQLTFEKKLTGSRSRR